MDPQATALQCRCVRIASSYGARHLPSSGTCCYASSLVAARVQRVCMHEMWRHRLAQLR